MKYRPLLQLSLLCLLLFAKAYAESPRLLHANVYDAGIDVKQYWVSEKLDGIRGYWDGRQLLSKQGNPIHAPHWFTAALPNVEMDGELWMGRNRFEQTASIVLDQTPNETEWRAVKYLLFDLPHSPGGFTQRLEKMQQLVKTINRNHIQVIPQFRVENRAQLQAKLEAVTQAGGEGLMLHLESAVYQDGRSNALLKLKPFIDAEARVIEHLPGKGKFNGMMGSILVETTDHKRFKIGSGFSLQQRQNPPAIGSTISYKYYGLTKNGIPKFASFIRVRPAE